jgi:hypothetical protein
MVFTFSIKLSPFGGEDDVSGVAVASSVMCHSVL